MQRQVEGLCAARPIAERAPDGDGADRGPEPPRLVECGVAGGGRHLGSDRLGRARASRDARSVEHASDHPGDGALELGRGVDGLGEARVAGPAGPGRAKPVRTEEPPIDARNPTIAARQQDHQQRGVGSSLTERSASAALVGAAALQHRLGSARERRFERKHDHGGALFQRVPGESYKRESRGPFTPDTEGTTATVSSPGIAPPTSAAIRSGAIGVRIALKESRVESL